jgi:hypothetical protein
MPKPINAPLEKVFPLKKWDESGETTVTVRACRQREQEAHDNLFAETTRIWDTGSETVQIKQKISTGEVVRTEVFLTIVDSNIIDESGTPVFRFSTDSLGRSKLAMTAGEFETAWGRLPTELADEIHEKVREMNAQWGGGAGKQAG